MPIARPDGPVTAILFTAPFLQLHARPVVSGKSGPHLRTSQVVSFKFLLEDGTAVNVDDLEHAINITIPFEPTPDPDNMLNLECRWYPRADINEANKKTDAYSSSDVATYRDPTRWSSEGCAARADGNGRVICACDQSNSFDFTIIESPFDDAAYESYLEQNSASKIRQQLFESCLAKPELFLPAAIESPLVPTRQFVAWSVLLLSIIVGFLLISCAWCRDRMYEYPYGGTYPRGVPEDPDAPLWTLLYRDTMRRIRKNGGITQVLRNNHPLFAGSCWRGLSGFTRTQTIQMAVNTIVLEIFLTGWLMSQVWPPDPVLDSIRVNATAADILLATESSIHAGKVFAYGSLSSIIAIPSVLAFMLAFRFDLILYILFLPIFLCLDCCFAICESSFARVEPQIEPEGEGSSGEPTPRGWPLSWPPSRAASSRPGTASRPASRERPSPGSSRRSASRPASREQTSRPTSRHRSPSKEVYFDEGDGQLPSRPGSRPDSQQASRRGSRYRSPSKEVYFDEGDGFPSRPGSRGDLQSSFSRPGSRGRTPSREVSFFQDSPLTEEEEMMSRAMSSNESSGRPSRKPSRRASREVSWWRRSAEEELPPLRGQQAESRPWSAKENWAVAATAAVAMRASRRLANANVHPDEVPEDLTPRVLVQQPKRTTSGAEVLMIATPERNPRPFTAGPATLDPESGQELRPFSAPEGVTRGGSSSQEPPSPGTPPASPPPSPSAYYADGEGKFLPDDGDDNRRDQYLGKAVLRRDYIAILRILIGWSLNWTALIVLLVLSLRNGCELSSWLMGLHFQLEWVFAFIWSFALRVFLLEPLLLRTILYFLQAEYKKKKKPKKASPGVTTPTRPSSGKRTRVAVDESRPASRGDMGTPGTPGTPGSGGTPSSRTRVAFNQAENVEIDPSPSPRRPKPSRRPSRNEPPESHSESSDAEETGRTRGAGVLE